MKKIFKYIYIVSAVLASIWYIYQALMIVSDDMLILFVKAIENVPSGVGTAVELYMALTMVLTFILIIKNGYMKKVI